VGSGKPVKVQSLRKGRKKIPPGNLSPLSGASFFLAAVPVAGDTEIQQMLERLSITLWSLYLYNKK
jgi:hypothetical protein